MKILHLNYSKSDGAGIAAERIICALDRQGVENKFLYLKPFNKGIAKISWLERKINGIKNIALQKVIPRNHSVNLFPSSLLRIVNESDADIVHLHWVNGEMISIKQIAKIKKPILWTFHDMWPFCGTEHYVTDTRFIDGYSTGKYISRGKGCLLPFDFNRWAFRRKLRAWESLNLHIACPSSTLADCARQSRLFKEIPVSVVPNCLDTEVFTPLADKIRLREKLGIPVKKKFILFGSSGNDLPRKGFDLLEIALRILPEQIREEADLVVFGGGAPRDIAGFTTHWLGRISDPHKLAEIYNIAEVMCVPARQEIFGQTASEALACGLPVVAFGNMGLLDIIDHKENGYLATPYDEMDFAEGIKWVLDRRKDHDENVSLCMAARQKVLRCFSEDVVARKYFALYQCLLG